MTRCDKFIDFVDSLIETTHSAMPEDALEFYNNLKSSREVFTEKKEITELGAQILYYLQGVEQPTSSSREIAEGIDQPSRTVSGAMRKLCTDGYVEKFGKNPVIYILTSKGKEFKGEK